MSRTDEIVCVETWRRWWWRNRRNRRERTTGVVSSKSGLLSFGIDDRSAADNINKKENSKKILSNNETNDEMRPIAANDGIHREKKEVAAAAAAAAERRKYRKTLNINATVFDAKPQCFVCVMCERARAKQFYFLCVSDCCLFHRSPCDDIEIGLFDIFVRVHTIAAVPSIPHTLAHRV